MNYSMEELLPVVAKLSYKFSSWESTSISYEKAQQFMEAVIFCINENDDVNMPASKEGLKAELAYKIGYEKVIAKTKESQEKYSKLLEIFDDYGNINLRDTVGKAISGFFTYYDPKLNPQDTIITMDYPVLKRNLDLKGIDAIAAYVDYIYLEQLFLKSIPGEIIREILRQYHKGYEREFFNISSCVLEAMLTKAVIRKEGAFENDSSVILWKIISEKTEQELSSIYKEWLHQLLQNEIIFGHIDRHDINKIEQYFLNDISDFVCRLKTIKDKEYLHNVVVL